MAIQNNGQKMCVDSFVRLDKIALELPPNNDPTFAIYPTPVISALGGLTAPHGAGGMIPPQNLPKGGVPGSEGFLVYPNTPEGDVPRSFVLSSAAPPDYTTVGIYEDGGRIIATPPPSVSAQEIRKGVMDIVGEADMRVLERENFFLPGQYQDEGQ